jgi:hypothetical protein
MTDGQNSTSGSIGGRKAYSANVQARAHSSTSCSFCWFVLAAYPALTRMTERDEATFRTHLQKVHGLKDEITQ